MTLQERMVELMTATGWTVGEIARIAGVTSAAVSQWVGNGQGKQSKSIGNAEAALRLERASGFSWIWLAQGKGPKLAGVDQTQPPPQADRSEADQLADALEVITKALIKADEDTRLSLEPLFASLARGPEKSDKKSQLILRLLITDPVHDILADDGARSTHPLGSVIGGSVSQDIKGEKDNGRSDRDAGKGSAQR